MKLEDSQRTEKIEDAVQNKTPFLSEFIAPWALPREEIPIHLVWEPNLEYDFIHVLIPPLMEVKEFFNVESYVRKDSIIVIKQLKTPNFFGFVVFFNEICKEQHEKKEIIVNFVRQGKVQYSHLFTANIYRPILTVVEKPECIVLSDESDPRSLVNISLKISGFGWIEVKSEISTGGRFISNPEPLYRELARRVISTFKFSESQSDKKKGIEINPLYIQQVTKEFVDKLKKGEFPLELNANDLEDFRRWLSEEKAQAQVMRLVSKQLENLLIDSLLFYLERYPAEGVELMGGRPTTIIESATHDLYIRFRYSDSLNNEYKPTQINISIKDLRKDKERKMELPINIQWTHELMSPLMEGGKC